MSGLFIAMFAARGGTRGQTLLIAVAKWIGTLAPTIVFGWYGNSPLILGVGGLCSVFDLAYIGLLWRATATRGHIRPMSAAEPADVTPRCFRG